MSRCHLGSRLWRIPARPLVAGTGKRACQGPHTQKSEQLADMLLSQPLVHLAITLGSDHNDAASLWAVLKASRRQACLLLRWPRARPGRSFWTTIHTPALHRRNATELTARVAMPRIDALDRSPSLRQRCSMSSIQASSLLIQSSSPQRRRPPPTPVWNERSRHCIHPPCRRSPAARTRRCTSFPRSPTKDSRLWNVASAALHRLLLRQSPVSHTAPPTARPSTGISTMCTEHRC